LPIIGTPIKKTAGIASDVSVAATQPDSELKLKEVGRARQTWQYVFMQNASVTIYCPNPTCQAPNPESHRFCQQCRTPIPKRYLWAIGELGKRQAGELLGRRYLIRQDRIVLDIYPGMAPESPETISPAIEAYLRLTPFQLHIPKIYGRVAAEGKAAEIILLEQAPIYPDGLVETATVVPGSLMPELTEVWKSSAALRQLNWLWQIAQLWQPLAAVGVASTLLNAELLRVEGSIVRVLELRGDRGTPPTLSDLGQLWRRWQPKAQVEIADFMAEFCQQLIRGQIHNAEQLMAVLDRAIQVCAQFQTRQIQLATRTDQGPLRSRNEDACYPDSGTVLTFSARENTTSAPEIPLPLVIVCDGIGGHEGGSVASHLAIDTLRQQLQALMSQVETIEPVTLTSALEQAVLVANDALSQRNDAEHRQERQRMGTTLVMALARAHELYLTHVGDSRAYRITRAGCHQVTLDDDLAAREVRLGYAVYRDALQQPGSGSLVQALGMGASSVLHPTVQRFVLDEDCLFLLCSDGLSDHDRVEENWHELLPLLEGKLDLATASQRLVTLANQLNGHDNVTVGLLCCRVMPGDRSANTPTVATTVTAKPNGPTQVTSSANHREPTAPGTTQILSPPRTFNPLLRLLGILSLWLVGGIAAYLLSPDVRSWVDSIVSIRPMPEPTLPEPTATPPSSPAPIALSVGSLVQIRPLPGSGLSLAPVVLQSQPGLSVLPTDQPGEHPLPAGTVLQILNRQTSIQRDIWLQLKVCSLPTSTELPLSSVQPGETGWVLEPTIAPLLVSEFTLTATELGKCAPVTASPTPRRSP
jgi:serine/threonine protein phosphatase PrpC